MDFVIESGIEQVSSKRGRKPTEFPLEAMQVGQSFLIPCNTEEKKEVESWRRKLLTAKKRFIEDFDHEAGGEFKFTTAVVSDGLRVWRQE
jgi:hypothetical protein